MLYAQLETYKNTQYLEVKMYKLISNLDVFARVEYEKECKIMCIDEYNGAYLDNFA